MGMMRRLLSISTGLAAGVMAYKLLDRYNQRARLEAEFRDLDLEEGDTVEAPAEEETPAEPAETPDQPKENPVMKPQAPLTVDEEGRVDPTKIADPADFADWDDLGCRG